MSFSKDISTAPTANPVRWSKVGPLQVMEHRGTADLGNLATEKDGHLVS